MTKIQNSGARGRDPFLDRHRLMSWWASSHTLYPDEFLGRDALHMIDRSYERLAIRLAGLIPALSRKTAHGLVRLNG